MRIWLWFLTCAAVASAVAAAVNPNGYGVFWVAVQAACVVAAVVGLRRNRPGPAAVYWLLVAGVGVSTATAAVQTAVPGLSQNAEAGYMLAYPLTGIALWRLARQLRPWSSTRLLDAAIAVIGMAQLAWAFVLNPLLSRAGLDQPTAAGVTAVAVCDLLVVSMLLRVAFAVRPGVAAGLLVASTAAMVLSDASYVIMYAWGRGGTVVSSATSAGWLMWSFLLAAACLHPGIRDIGERPRTTDESATPIAAFIALAMLGPAVLIADIGIHRGAGSWAHAVVPTALTAALMVTMVLRLGRALRERTSLQRELTFRAQHDVLTGLANREEFRVRLQADIDALAASAAGGHPAPGIGLLIVDLDGFKDVNDTLGHPAGDELLLQATARLHGIAGPGDLLARLGGDEFALVAAHLDGLDGLAAQCVAALAVPYLVDGRELRLTASVGVYSGAPASTGEALQSADLALYAAKEAGRNRAERYDPRLRAAHVAHAVLADQLRASVDAESGFAVHYQPVVDIHTGSVRAVEALLRYTTPDGAAVSPARFVPVAEETGLIGRLGAWVLERACTDARAWHASHGISVTVNVSGRQLRNPQFADDVLATLKRTGLPGAALVLEITETVLVTATVEETEAVSRRLARLRAHGIRIAIDDFGTGYSSLAYLRTLPIDVLKIDRSFVSRVAERQEKALFRAVVELARSMHLQPVAEGVETEEQAAALRELDCGYAQGFLFARPMPADALRTLLSAQLSTVAS
ncbi:bifunctional diguanylate cyclase/phosphodiesterase [Dactylosporangium sp. NPDC049525]|uniref:putative bifunctional diguanylate cyclase/phosphodiesterase n=1 Tax=Dactylosporangium sp. NPDC049525 TaxID=3154730 RepID=UPI0034416535